MALDLSVVGISRMNFQHYLHKVAQEIISSQNPQMGLVFPATGLDSLEQFHICFDRGQTIDEMQRLNPSQSIKIHENPQFFLPSFLDDSRDHYFSRHGYVWAPIHNDSEFGNRIYVAKTGISPTYGSVLNRESPPGILTTMTAQDDLRNNQILLSYASQVFNP